MMTLDERVRIKEEAAWRDERARMSMLLTDTDAVMSRAEFEELSEYSETIPSGTYIGKLWRCRAASGPLWLLGEYFGTPGRVAIWWRQIHVVDDPAVWVAAEYGERGATERPSSAALP